MRKLLRILALALLTCAVGTWLATGAKWGWTKTSVPVKTLDEVTGIEGVEYKRHFVAGVDFLGVAFVGAGLLVAASALFRKNQTKTRTT